MLSNSAYVFLVLFIGAAFTTCFRSLSKFRYPGGFFGRGCWLSASALSFRSGIVTPSPGRKSVSCRLRNRELCKSVESQSPRARYSGTTVRQDNGTDGTVQY